MAWATAAMMPRLVMVAPETVSTDRLWAATMAPGTVAMAPAEIPGVSGFVTTATFSIFFSESVTSTTRPSCMPFTVCLYTPGFIALIAVGAGASAFTVSLTCWQEIVSNAAITTARTAKPFIRFFTLFLHAAAP